MNVLVAAVGTSGDVFPFIGLADALSKRGHRVTLIANDQFQEHAARLGLGFASIGTAEQYRRAFADPKFWDWRHAFPKVVQQLSVPCMQPVFDAIERNLVPGDTVVVGSTLAWGARVAREVHEFPLVTASITPINFRSAYDAPLIHPAFLQWLPSPLMRLQYWLLDRLSIDPTCAGPLNEFRAKHHLRPQRGILRDWLLSPDLVLGLFPEWYWPRQSDLPKQVKHTGFVMYDGLDVVAVPDDLRQFIEEGPPPIVFTPGSAMLHASKFFAQAVAACQELGRRGLLMTSYVEQVPNRLPEGVRQAGFAPFSWLFPRVAALVHHGGVGTTARALAAGIPQLVMPMAHDQFDNAQRVRKLGVGDSIDTEAFEGPLVARKLRTLLEAPHVAQSCRKWAGQFGSAELPLAEACRAIEDIHRSLAVKSQGAWRRPA